MRIRNVLATMIVAAAATGMAASSVQAQVDYSNFNHMECYQIRDIKDSNPYTVDVDSLDETMLPANTFGKSCTFKRFAREYCVASKTENVNPVPPSENVVDGNGPVPQAFDYICYNVRCTQTDQPARGTTVGIEDRFGPRTVTVKKMKKICVPIVNKF